MSTTPRRPRGRRPLRLASGLLAVALLLSGCIERLLQAGRLTEACHEIEDFEYPRERRLDLRHDLRARSDATLEIRPLAIEEFTARTGAPPPDGYGARALLVELTFAGSQEVGLEVEELSFEPRPRDAYWSSFPGQLTDLYPPPPPPEGHWEPPGTDWSSVHAILGLLGLFTGITPSLSLLAHRDLVTPLLKSQPPGGRFVPPSDEAKRRYEADPRTVAAAAAAERLGVATDLRAQRCRLGAGRRCTFLALLVAHRDTLDAPPDPAPPRPPPGEWLDLSVRLVYPPLDRPPQNRPCPLPFGVRLKLAGADSLGEQLRRSFAGRTLPIARLPRGWEPGEAPH